MIFRRKWYLLGSMYSQVRAFGIDTVRRAMQRVCKGNDNLNAAHSIRLKAGAGASGPIPGSVPSFGGGGGADFPDLLIP